MSAYTEKLKDPRWQRKRLEILNRDEFTCRACASKEKTLHVHHLFYRRGADPWDYPNGSLITFCFECHEFAHAEQQPAIEAFLRSLHEFGATYSDLAGVAAAVDFCLTPHGIWPSKQITADQWTLVGQGLAALIATAHDGADLAAAVARIRS